MASLDFIEDISQNLKKDKIDYIIIALRRGKRSKKANANIYLNIPNKKSKQLFQNLLFDLQNQLEE